MQITPDSKYAYVWYDDSSLDYLYYLGLFNLTTGTFTHYSLQDLGISPDRVPSSTPKWVSISPDGKWLMLPTVVGDRPRIKIFDISARARPKPVGLITPVPVPGRGFPQVNQLQVVGNKLYSIDLNGIVAVFNFSPDKGDFREAGYFVSNSYFGGAAFSSDATYLYVTDPLHDQVSVLNTALLASGKDALVTNVRAPIFPGQVAVSPVPPPVRNVRAQLGFQAPGKSGTTVPAERHAAQDRPE